MSDTGDALRVLLISGEYPPMEGGVADFTRLLGEAMATLGAEVHVLTSSTAAQGPASVVRCHALLASWRWRPLYTALQSMLREIRPQVINIQYQTAAYGMHPAINLLPLMMARGSGRPPVVVTFHDLLVPYLFPKAGALRWGANLALARGSHAVVVTNAEDYARLAHYRWLRNLVTIPIGSNIRLQLPAGYDRDEWRKHLGLSPDCLLLCYFGFLNASKGGEELIAALDVLRARGYNVALLMIGGAVGASDPTNRGYLDLVRRSIHERGLQDRVVWTGHMPPEAVSASFRAADLCVLPYRDGVSFRRGSFMAALAHAMPIVTTQPEVPLPELIDERTVLQVPRRDAAALAGAITRLAEDAELRSRLGTAAQELAQRFSWDGIATKTLQVYRAIVSGQGRDATKTT